MSIVSTLAMLTGWILLAHVGSRMVGNYARSGALDPLEAARCLEIQLAAFRWIGLGVSVLCLLGFGLGRSMESIPIVSESMFLQSILLLFPAIAITCGTWSAEHFYGVRMQYTDGTLKNYVVSIWRSFRSGLAWLVVPVLILLMMVDAIAMMPLSPTAAAIVTLVAVVIFIPLALPWLVQRLFPTESLPEHFANWIPGLLTRVGLRRTKVVRWNTNDTNFNAMVAGFVPPVRSLFLSDRILDELPNNQIALIVLHEAAHLKRFHVPLRMLSVIPAWAVGLAITRIGGETSWSMAAGSAVGLLLTLLVLRAVAYRTEHDADIDACRTSVALSDEFDQLPNTYQEAVEVMGSALRRVTFDHPAGRKPTWLHPGVEQRIDTMRKAAEPSTYSVCWPE